MRFTSSDAVAHSDIRNSTGKLFFINEISLDILQWAFQVVGGDDAFSGGDIGGGVWLLVVDFVVDDAKRTAPLGILACESGKLLFFKWRRVMVWSPCSFYMDHRENYKLYKIIIFYI